MSRLTPQIWWEPRRKFQDRVWLHVLLLVLTLGSTTLVGISHYLRHSSQTTRPPRGWPCRSGQLLLRGLWYSGTVLAILGCHELGHYYACRYYDVDASLPYFLPFPLSIIGTFGAFIRFASRFRPSECCSTSASPDQSRGSWSPCRRSFIGITMSHVVRVPPDFVGFELGEPLLFQLSTKLLWGQSLTATP